MNPPDAIRVGTASWTDPEFIKAGWYPDDVKNDAEGRLRYYASQFPMVEVNATFYALPRRSTVDGWAERTPDGGMTFRISLPIERAPEIPAEMPSAIADGPATDDPRR